MDLPYEIISLHGYINVVTREPLEAMIRKNKDGFLYIPLSIIQAELLLIFKGMTKWEMLSVSGNKEGLWGYGKLWYKVPTQDDWLFQTGTAAVPLSKKMRLGYPSLESHCILNAAKKIGPWFGQNLNRDKDDEFIEDDGVPVIQVEKSVTRILELIETAKSEVDLAKLKPDVDRVESKDLNSIYMKKLRSFFA